MPRAILLIDRAIQALRRRFRREPWWAELWAAVAAILWGLWVMVAGSDLSHAEAYRIILSFADERVWIASALTLGALHIVTVMSDRVAARRLICGVAAWWWTVLLLSMFLVVPATRASRFMSSWRASTWSAWCACPACRGNPMAEAGSPLWILAASAFGPLAIVVIQAWRGSKDKGADRDAAARESFLDRLEREVRELRARVDEVEAERDRVWLAARAMERFAIQVVRQANVRLQGASSAGRLQGAGVLMPNGQQAETPAPLDPPPALESFLQAPPAD